MYLNVFFLVITLLMINLSPIGLHNDYTSYIGLQLGLPFLLYVALLLLILFQDKFLAKKLRFDDSFWDSLASVETLLLLSSFSFFFLIQQFIYDNVTKQFAATVWASLALLFYFSSIAFHYFVFYPNNRSKANEQLRLLVPFVIPFLVFIFFADCISIFSYSSLQDHINREFGGRAFTFIWLAMTLIFMGGILIFFPPIIVRFWECREIEDGSLKQQLVDLCQRCHFKHGGMKEWKIMNRSLTAAILGVYGRFRYVIFSRKILSELSPKELSAVLAHEIGHSYHKHLLIYPLIILGALILSWILSDALLPIVFGYIGKLSTLYPSTLWQSAYPLLFFVFLIIFLAIYFRSVFGFFSRLFERQADLHVYHAHLPPEDMIAALDKIGYLTGGTHDIPSWHHYSIRQRIDFLQNTIEHPEYILRHHRKTRFWLIVYFILLFLGILILF